MSFLNTLKEIKRDAIEKNKHQLEVDWSQFFRYIGRNCEGELRLNPNAKSTSIDLLSVSTLVVADLNTPQGQERLSMFLGELPFTITDNTLHITWGEL